MPFVPRGKVVVGGAREAAEAFVGHPVEEIGAVALPGRLERRPGEIRDGAHNPDGLAWLRARLPTADYTVCASILADKDVDEMLRRLAPVGDADSWRPGRRTPARWTRSSSRSRHVVISRSWRRWPTRQRAVRRAHELGEPVLVTGSLYLLADLEAAATR